MTAPANSPAPHPPFLAAQMLGLTRRALQKIDLYGPRGLTMVSMEELDAMATTLVCLGVSPCHIPNRRPDMMDPSPISSGREMINGREMIGDGRGGYIPVQLVKPQHLLEDEMVRKIMGYALPLSAQVARFKEHTFDDISGLEALLAQHYGVTKRGKKGNRTFLSVDRLIKVQVQVAEHIAFGPELQIAKELVDECLNEWAATARPEVQAIVTRAFNTDKEGQISRAAIYMLLALEIDDPRWLRGMDAIRDAMRVVGSKTYVRCYIRQAFDAPWEPVTIDLAKA